MWLSERDRTELLGEIVATIRAQANAEESSTATDSESRAGVLRGMAEAIQARFGTPETPPHKCQACLRMIREPADHDAECLFGGTGGDCPRCGDALVKGEEGGVCRDCTMQAAVGGTEGGG